VAFSFFDDDGFNFEVQTLLGSVRTGCGDAGEILATVATIANGDATSWVSAWQALGDRVAAIADAAAARHHGVSARDAYLRAATYYATALTSVDGVDDPDTALHQVFAQHRRCFDAYVERLEPPAFNVDVPYGHSRMPGYLFVPDTGGTPRGTLVLNNGSDGAVTSLLGMAKAACDRGYNALIFDGPGQQSVLFEQGIPFRADWEHVITPIVDFLSQRPEVDPDRISTASARPGTGYHGRSPTSIASPRRWPTPASSMCRRHGCSTSRRRWSPCWSKVTARPSISGCSSASRHRKRPRHSPGGPSRTASPIRSISSWPWAPTGWTPTRSAPSRRRCW